MATSVLDLLVEIQLIDDRQHEDVLSRAASKAGGHLIQTMCELGYATESSIARALAAELGLQRADFGAAPEPEALALLDGKTCRDRFVLPLALREGGALLWLAMADPTDSDTIGLVARKTRRRVRPLAGGPSEILRAVAGLYKTPSTDPVAPPAPAVEESVSPLARIAAALGVRVPKLSQRKPAPGLAPKAPAAAAPAAEPAPLAGAGAAAADGPLVDDLSQEDLETIEALRASLEKSAVVLRAIAELCIEKGVFTREEAVRKQ